MSRTRCNASWRCGAEPGAVLRERSERWAPALQRTVEETLRCVRGTRPARVTILRNCIALSKSRPCLRILAAGSARALLSLIAQWKPKGAGKAGRRLAPESVRHKSAHGVDHRCCRSPGLPCADGFNGVLRALLGERCTIAPVALQMADARARSGRYITAGLDAQTPGVRTTRLLRPRTVPPDRPGLARAHPR